MSYNRKGFKKDRYSRHHKEIKKIIQHLKEGSRTTRDLVEKVAGKYSLTTRKRIVRHLEELRNWGLVEKPKERRGKWRWFEHLLRYGSGEEYNIAWKHSRSLLREATLENASGIREISPEHVQFLDHIRSGYPKIHELYEEVGALRGELKGRKERLDQLIEKEIKDKKLKPGSLNQDQIRKIINWHNSGQLRSSPDDIVEEKGRIVHSYLRADAIAIKGAVNPKRIKQVLQKLKKSRKVKEASKSFNESQERLQEKNSELEVELLNLKRDVDDGVPLMGSCSRCSKVRIGPRQEGDD